MKRIVAALQMLIFGAVGLQIRPSRKEEVAITKDFEVELGAELEIKGTE